MNQNEIKRLTGLAMYIENDNFYALIKTPEFKTYLLENSDFITNMLIESFRISNYMSDATLPMNQQPPFISNEISSKSTLTNEKNTTSLTLNQSVSISSPKETTKTNITPEREKALTSIIGLNLDLIENDVLETICIQTGYPKDMVEPEIDLEADLGVDTVKKMEIIAELAEKYKLQFRKDFNMTQLSTVRSISNLILEDVQKQNERNQPSI